MPELKQRGIFSAVYFVYINLPEERFQVLLSEKKLKELRNDYLNILKKSNIDCYMGRPRATFYNVKNSFLNDFCYAEFLAFYTLENKSNKTCENQPDELDHDMIESNYGSCS